MTRWFGGLGVPGVHGNDARFKLVGAVLVPEHIAEEIGFGCDLCDDHELVPIAHPDKIAIIAKFRERHRGHGKLHTLERRNGRVIATSEVEGLP